MRLLIISSTKEDSARLVKEIQKWIKIKEYALDNTNIDIINSTIATNKDWLIQISNKTNFNVIANQSNKIIYMNYKNDILDNEQITKYKQKIIILKNKKEEKAILKSLEKGHEFYY